MFDADITNMSNMKILEKIGKLAADCLKSDLSKRPEMKYVVQRLYMLTEKYHEKGEEETGISGIRGAKTSSRESTVTLNRRGSWDIFNRNARSNYYSRNGSAILENTETVKIFKKEELKPIIKYSNIIMGGGRFYSVY
ncbi:hypothetical protein PR202_ga07295 [Eleusine coracana subsp. coracana]|uniref:Uncharacterized protein n=1 Tax=Eleusine coracana subsp. coracana TaxID=191504 RepID=A0AAV5BZ87_ELECO|nr:hypothetical protein PR202_ga07295 [Eleusine coracana subsp. coracana]